MVTIWGILACDGIRRGSQSSSAHPAGAGRLAGRLTEGMASMVMSRCKLPRAMATTLTFLVAHPMKIGLMMSSAGADVDGAFLRSAART